MSLTFHRCDECKKHRGGDLLPFENRWFCRKCWLDRLQWDEQRGEVISAIRSMAEFELDLARVGLKLPPTLAPVRDWRGFIEECAGLAAIAMTHDDRRTFIHYFSRAVWAWDLERLP